MFDLQSLKTDPVLLKKIEECRHIWNNMTTEQRQESLKLQAESWVRQDMD